MSTLDLSENQLSGSISSKLGNLNNLRYLYLDYNNLSGSIPSQLGNLTNLIAMGLSNNHLSESIPSQLGNLRNLQRLYLDNNHLSGIIPSSFTELVSILTMGSFEIGYNCLSASDPELIAWLNDNDPDWEDHQDQCAVPNTPTVTTNSVSSIKLNSAVCGGNVTSDGGASVTARGVCWNTAVNPTTSNSKTTDGTGSGSFTSGITGLTAGVTYYVRAYAANSIGTSYGSAMSFTTLPPEPPVIGLSRKTLNFGALTSGAVTGAQTVLISNNGGGTLNWSASGNVSRLYINPSSGTGDSVPAVSVNPFGLTAGSYSGTISITDLNATNSPQAISVQLQIYNPGTTAVPFGDFSTPVEGSSTYNSVPVTGWAIDDIGVASVKIYNGESYIAMPYLWRAPARM
ncbi:MAG: hypothetical protein NT166_25845 [Candidatus Aminicenantes bacterium]|nr:hypothetical protein [Candidatus Aminicenantes bacterium]